MRLPVDWLNEYVPNTLPVKDLAFLLTNVGLEVEAIEGAGEAAAFDIKVTPNRGDCLSLVGVARELAMKLRQPMTECAPQVIETGPPADTLVRVTLADPARCPRYSARIVRGVKIGPSPAWAQRRLERCGVRPINNIVDATNLVMLELGQPLHAFDYMLLQQRSGKAPEIIVRMAQADERIVTIDGEERALTPEVLLITDPNGPIALAGIMGGASTEIHDGTTEVLLESAHFDPSTIRRGARLLGMSTEASYRFERVVDPSGTIRALDRAGELIAEFSETPVEIATGVVDAYPAPVTPNRIELRPARVNALLGLTLSAEVIAEHLRWLKLEVAEGDPLTVLAPAFRPDLVTEIDLVEEVARVHGYEDIAETLPGITAGVGGRTPSLTFEREVRTLLRGLGLSETVTSSLESNEAHDRLGLPVDDPRRRAVVISNWKTADRTQLRTTLMTSLLDVLALNRRNGITDVAVFDLGRVYLPTAGANLPDQPSRLALAVMGNMVRGNWAKTQASPQWDFYALKGVVENLLEALARCPGEFADGSEPWLRPGRTATVSINGVNVGVMGELQRGVRAGYDLPDPVFVAEFELEKIREQSATTETTFRPLSRFPAVTRDVAFLVEKDVLAKRAGQIIQEAAGPDLESVELFDAFEGKPLPEGRRNLAYSLTFRCDDRTLTDEEVDAAMEQVRAALREQLGAQIRE